MNPLTMEEITKDHNGLYNSLTFIGENETPEILESLKIMIKESKEKLFEAGDTLLRCFFDCPNEKEYLLAKPNLGLILHKKGIQEFFKAESKKKLLKILKKLGVAITME